jgi:uncharacterized protein (TIGR02246 family)
MAVVSVAACSDDHTTVTHDAKADEAAIAAQNQKWLLHIASKDAAGVAQIYVEEGAMFPPNAPKVEGRAGLQAAWGEMFKAPGMALTFKTDKIVFSADGSMATDIGTYDLGMGDAANRMTDKGKYVVVWTKRNGTWLVLTDMFSSDAPPPAPPPSTAAAPDALTAVTPSLEPAIALMASDPLLQWGPCPAPFPTGCELTVVHGNPAGPNADVFLRVPSNYEIPAHIHSSAERMILVSGQLEVTYQGQPAATLEVGSYAFGPAKRAHKATCKSADPCTLFIAFELPVDAQPYDGPLN